MDNKNYDSADFLENQEDQTIASVYDEIPDVSAKKVWNVWDKKEAIITRERKIRRLTFANLPFEVAKVFDLNKGFFYTFLGLFTKPSSIILSFLGHERDRVANPLKYLLIITGIVLFLVLKFNYFDFEAQDFPTESSLVDADKIQLFNESINKFYLGFWNMWILGSILTTGFFSFLFFRRTGFNLVEQFAINTYTSTQGYVLLIPLILLKMNSSKEVMIWACFYLIYVTVVFSGLFKNSPVKTLLKVLVINILGVILFYLTFLVFAGTYLASGFITG
jgi:hypothetical protein